MSEHEFKFSLEPGDGMSPDASLSCLGAEGLVLASCGLWWRRTPLDPEGGGRVGCVGRFECQEVAAGAGLLEEACKRLAEFACKRVAGPMDGDTWHAYRLVSDGWERSPRFFLEPWNRPEDCMAFERAGFVPWARFSSSSFSLAAPDELEVGRRERLLARLSARGVAIRPLRLDAFEDELERLHHLSCAAFSDNFLYTPISREAFLALYRPLRDLVNPDLVRLAEKDGVTVGFVFAVPDALAAAGRLVVKTLAVHPRFRHLGLGTILVDLVQEAARAVGFRVAVHALQHETNASLKITGRNAGTAIRGYTLYQRILQSS